MKYINIILLLILITIGLVKSENFACSPFSKDTGSGPSIVSITVGYEVCTLEASCSTNTSTIVVNRGVPHFIDNFKNSSSTNETGTYYNVAFYYDGENVCLYSNLTSRSLFFGSCATAITCEVNCLSIEAKEESAGFSYYDTCNGLLSNRYKFSIYNDDEPSLPKGCNEPSAPTDAEGPEFVLIAYKNFVSINNSKVYSEGETISIQINAGVFWGNVNSSGFSDNAVYYDGEKVCIYSLFNNSDCTNNNGISCSENCLYIDNSSERDATVITSSTKNCDTSVITETGFYLTLTVTGEETSSSSSSSTDSSSSSSSSVSSSTNSDSSSQDGSVNSSNKIINSIILLLSLIIISIIM